jgi:2-hydroxy-6-oxo-6-(2'-carboxyphenyl)-hexa-2,4-dienoate hydrolase
METQRRDFLKQVAAGAASVPFLAAPVAYGAANATKSRDSKLMGAAKFVDVEGIRTRYFDGGTGEPLVLVHGGQWPSTSSADLWAPAFDHLAEHFHVYAFDKLGHGFTDNPKTDADFSMDAITRHAYGFIQAMGIRRAVLAGHSRGALPVARIAADHPELVSHLVIMDSNTLAPDDPNTPDRVDPPLDRKIPTRQEVRAAALASRQTFRKDFLTESYVEAEYRIAQLPKLQEVARRFNTARDNWVRDHPDLVKQHPLWQRNMGATTWWMYQTKYETLDRIKAGRLKAPTIIIWGFNDPTAPYFLGVNLMETLSKVVDRTELHIINQSGHLVYAEHPEEVTRLIVGFING